MNILGISALYHDSAAALVIDGEIIAAAQEERFTRVKHDHRFPAKSLHFCLDYAKLKVSDLDYVVFYDKPLLKFDRIVETYVAFAPRGFRSFMQAIPLWLKEKVNIRREIRKQLGRDFHGKIVFPEHHESHAASGFFPSPFDEAAILTVDGVGEWATASVGVGKGNSIDLLYELRFPHSLGLLYSAFTTYTGFKINSGEYKLMGLAPYGKPLYIDKIKKMVDIKEDGSLWMDMSYFNYCQGLTMTSKKFHVLFNGPPRNPQDEINRKQMDEAASIQAVTEEIMVKMARFAAKETGMKNLCLSGGVALNCVANGRILQEKIFDNIWIQPAAGDAGGALGAALITWYQLLGKPRTPSKNSQKGSLLGIEYRCAQIQEFLDSTNATYQQYSDEACIALVAEYIAAGKVIGWFSGRMEYGPRALGCRSIIGDARSRTMQSTMNLKIKYRESFRPFAPSVLVEDVAEYFDLDRESPYMLIVAPVAERKRLGCKDAQEGMAPADSDVLKRANTPRSVIPAVTHIDYSARVQTVDNKGNGRFYRLLRAFKEKTGCPVIINTSFNVRGEPIVCSPKDAFTCFMNTEMDVLVMENFIVLRTDQQLPSEAEVEKFKNSVPLD
ncbi:MAG: carbamoyltransferase [Pseudomonadota bacterium]